MIFVFDWDYTLCGSHNKLKPDSIKAIEMIHQMGHKIIIATGRHPKEIIDKIYNNKYISNYIIGANGGIIMERNTNNILYMNPIMKLDINKIILDAKKENAAIGYMNKKYVYFANCSKIKKYLKFPNMIDDIPYISKQDELNLKGDISLISLRFDDKFMLSKYYDHFLKKYKNLSVVSDGFCYIQFTNENINKWQTIKYLMNYTNNKEKIIAFGDSSNDIEMLKNADISVAMGNATNEIKNIADIVIGHCDNKGILNFIKKIKNNHLILDIKK